MKCSYKLYADGKHFKSSGLENFEIASHPQHFCDENNTNTKISIAIASKNNFTPIILLQIKTKTLKWIPIDCDKFSIFGA